MAIFGAIDIGTNSTRLLIAEIDDRGIIKKIVKNRLTTTRIGQGIGVSCLLQKEAMERTISTLKDYKGEIERYQVDKIRVVATSAVRDAKNGHGFQNLVRNRTGLSVDIISGEEEARLSYLGVVGGLKIINNDKIVVVDVGGGSTEVIFRDSLGKLFCDSVPIGAVRMTEEGYNAQQSEKVFKEKARKIPFANCKLIGVGGTITSLAAVDLGLGEYDPAQVHGHQLGGEKIESLLKVFEDKSLEERKRIPGLQPKRADIIIAGTKIFKSVLKIFKVDKITVSETDILYGIIFSMEKNNS